MKVRLRRRKELENPRAEGVAGQPRVTEGDSRILKVGAAVDMNTPVCRKEHNESLHLQSMGPLCSRPLRIGKPWAFSCPFQVFHGRSWTQAKQFQPLNGCKLLARHFLSSPNRPKRRNRGCWIPGCISGGRSLPQHYSTAHRIPGAHRMIARKGQGQNRLVHLPPQAAATRSKTKKPKLCGSQLQTLGSSGTPELMRFATTCRA
jgi:hypothetical protein